jgi:hypothetical protein
MRSKLGVFAKAGALAAVSSDNPQPSRMHKTTGLGMLISGSLFGFCVFYEKQRGKAKLNAVIW